MPTMQIVTVLIVMLAGAAAATRPAHHEQAPAAAQAYPIPGSIVAEHHELHAALGALTALGGKTGVAAREVERTLAPHFAKEEEYALPPLALLRPLAAGKITADMRATAKLAARLKTELPHMLAEHQAIVKTLDALAEAARAERQDAALDFVDTLKLHAQHEEEILYPAAILVGEYLALKL